jgi:hypothetical protein
MDRTRDRGGDRPPGTVRELADRPGLPWPSAVAGGWLFGCLSVGEKRASWACGLSLTTNHYVSSKVPVGPGRHGRQGLAAAEAYRGFA